jgi:hypothetical protein
MDNIIAKKLVKKIEKKENCNFEVLNLDKQLILFANRGTVDKIKKRLNKKLASHKSMLKIINPATAYIVPRVD